MFAISINGSACISINHTIDGCKSYKAISEDIKNEKDLSCIACKDKRILAKDFSNKGKDICANETCPD
jgi:hypothetical protein